MVKKNDSGKTGDKVIKLEKKQNSKVVQEYDGIITKIKIKKEIPEIYCKKDGDKTNRTMIVKGKAKPLDEFLAALQDLKDFFLEVCDLEQHREKTSILIVSFSEKGVIITGQYELSKIKTSITVNSPLVRYDKNAGGYEITAETKEKLDRLKYEAVRYLKGDAAEKQMELFEEIK